MNTKAVGKRPAGLVVAFVQEENCEVVIILL